MDNQLPEVTPARAAEMVSEGAFLLDVREQDEWDAGHAPTAIHIPMGQIAARRDELPEGAAILCVCHLGGRSAAVTEALLNAGHQAINVAGGMEAWAGAGLPVVK
ncbi:MAG: rhodanese-like domain-containing protein [Acidimicrobiales bacterium]